MSIFEYFETRKDAVEVMMLPKENWAQSEPDEKSEEKNLKLCIV